MSSATRPIRIVIANTKGFTGHAMGTGIEDVVAVKALETGCVPPVANFKEIDPELGPLNLSKGGVYPVEYALRLGAGFGSQISMMLLRWVPTKDGVRPSANALGYAYRIADADSLESLAEPDRGPPGADLEVVQRTLRVHDARRADARQRKPFRILQPAPAPEAHSPSPPSQPAASSANLRRRRKSVAVHVARIKARPVAAAVNPDRPLRQPIR